MNLDPSYEQKTEGEKKWKFTRKRGKFNNKINKNPLKMSNSLDKIYFGGLKPYIIRI